jgi:hypothetical protein
MKFLFVAATRMGDAVVAASLPSDPIGQSADARFTMAVSPVAALFP